MILKNCEEFNHKIDHILLRVVYTVGSNYYNYWFYLYINDIFCKKIFFFYLLNIPKFILKNR